MCHDAPFHHDPIHPSFLSGICVVLRFPESLLYAQAVQMLMFLQTPVNDRRQLLLLMLFDAILRAHSILLRNFHRSAQLGHIYCSGVLTETIQAFQNDIYMEMRLLSE